MYHDSAARRANAQLTQDVDSSTRRRPHECGDVRAGQHLLAVLLVERRLHHDGTRRPASANARLAAARQHLTASRSCIVSISSTSTPPASRPAHLLVVAVLHHVPGRLPERRIFVPGPIDPTTYRGRSGVSKRSHACRRDLGGHRLFSNTRSPMSASAIIDFVAPNVFVSTASHPTAGTIRESRGSRLGG
jgi:hypothetical protein